MSNTDHRTPDEIERDINDTRAELDATLDALQDRLNPQAAMDQAISYARENGGLFGRNLMEQVRDNPLPALLAGIGLTWLMTARDSGPSASRIGSSFNTVRGGLAGAASRGGDGAGSAADSVRGSAGAARERMAGASGAAKDRVSGASDEARERLHGARNAAGARMGAARERAGAAYSGASERAGEMYDRAGDSLRTAGGYARDNPLMLGMAAAAIGVVAAAMMPRTRTEEEYYEPMRERVRDQARDVGERARDAAHEAGHRAIDQAEDKMRKAEDKVEKRTGGEGSDKREAGTSGPGATRESSTSGLTDAEKASRAQSVAGNASRPGPLPEEEGRPGREAGASDTGWVRPASGAAQSNPRPGLSGSPGLDTRNETR